MSQASKRLQTNILSRLESQKPPKVKPRKLTPQPVDRDCGKTPLMLVLEVEHGQPIEQLVWSDSSRKLVTKLGIGKGTISYWRKKYPVQHTKGVNNRKVPVSGN